ncbi:prokineticin receptor 2-like [Strongylocentrotus purpuratus]|uniref:G-protein coupled receptors family 1 profile domain-containing protein n=1 Tax=Strongylocentrotus purpuratus TaxID=7668 RepID=A0A7M7SYN9_STRPU|nr:prokineticin receptor 2-like [Strongylocentrotus purpuratus]
MVANLSNDHHETTALPSPTSYDRHRDLVINHDPTSVVVVVEGVTLIVIFLGALVANVIAMTAILRDKLLRKNLHNWLILNLFVNDLGITITSMSFSIVSVFDHGQFLVNNDVICLVGTPGLNGINGTGAVGFFFGNFATILAISVDRYLTVVWSTRFPPTKSRTIVFIVLCYVVPLINVLPPIFKFLSDFKYHPDTHHCSPAWESCLYYIICFTIIFCITVLIMVFCYTGVVLTLRRQELQLRSFSKDNRTAPPRVVTPEPSGKILISTDVTSYRNIKTASSTDEVTKSSEDCLTEDFFPSVDADVEEPSNCLALKIQDQKDHEDEMTRRKRKLKKRNHQLMQGNLSMEKRVALTGTNFSV